MKALTRSIASLALVAGLAFSYGCGDPPEVPTVPDPESVEAPAPAVPEAPVEAAAPAAAAGEAVLALENPSWDDFVVDRAIWVGAQGEFVTGTDEGNLTAGTHSLRANTRYDDDRIRDLYVAKHIQDLEPGATYKVSIDFRFDSADNSKNYMQYTVRGGNHTNPRRMADMEHYEGHERPDTYQIPYGDERIGSGEFHTIEYEYTLGEDEDSITYFMIVRFRATNRNLNWFWMDNFRLERMS